jgi:hypothetical protein
MNQIQNTMSTQVTETKKLLSYTIAEWACALKYENLSSEAIQAAKLCSISCALGGSHQGDAKILLEHYRVVGGARKQFWPRPFLFCSAV